ncbi:hypothetical protein ACFXKY_12300 [Streptomyces canus]|uniref:hypothetical protein n=1 Tax=Streptomyces canus TaxID=58343 RepID=UPI0036CAB6B5
MSFTDLDRDHYRATVQEHRGDPAFWSVPLYGPRPGRELDSALYARGPLMLHALRRTVGDPAFFDLLRTWSAKYRDGNAAWPEFQALVAELSHRDLRGFFSAWAHGTQIPRDRYLYPAGLSRPATG